MNTYRKGFSDILDGTIWRFWKLSDILERGGIIQKIGSIKEFSYTGGVRNSEWVGGKSASFQYLYCEFGSGSRGSKADLLQILRMGKGFSESLKRGFAHYKKGFLHYKKAIDPETRLPNLPGIL